MHERAVAESFRVYHLLLCKSSQEMPDTGGRPNACYSSSSQFLLFVFLLLLFISTFLLFFLVTFWNYSLNYRARGRLRFLHAFPTFGSREKWDKKPPSLRIIDFNDSLALFWNEKPKSTVYELHSSQCKTILPANELFLRSCCPEKSFSPER